MSSQDIRLKRSESKAISVIWKMNSNSIEFSTWVKMKPIKTNQQVLTWLCVCQADETISKRKRMAHIFFASFIFSANFILIPISVAYFLRFVSVDLEQALYALFQLSGMLGMTYMMIAAFILRHEINDLFGKLADIYNNCKRFGFGHFQRHRKIELFNLQRNS